MSQLLVSLVLVGALVPSVVPVTAQEWIPGTELIVTVKGSLPAQRYFLLGNDSDLTVLHLDPALPAPVRNVLLDMASHHPNNFIAAQHGATFALAKDVRVTPEGVFVANRKVEDLQLDTSAKSEVIEIKTRQKGKGFWGHVGGLGGFFVGAVIGSVVGGIVAGVACQGAKNCHSAGFAALVLGELVGGILGAVHGHVAANRETEEVLYPAP